MTHALTQAPSGPAQTFLGFPLALDLDALDAEVAILGIPYGMPYGPAEMANDQSRAPDAIRQASDQSHYSRECFDWDLNGPLGGDREIRVVDCGNVTADRKDHREHYRRAEAAARKILRAQATLVTLGGDHGVPIPVMRALEEVAEGITLVHVDAHLDWRDQSKGEREGFRSPIRRASEMAWIDKIVQIGIRGSGSLRPAEVAEVRSSGTDIITAYEMHDIGMAAVLDRIPGGGPYYLTIDADGLDPTIMPAVMSPTPGGLTWLQIRQLVRGLFDKGPVLGMDLVEIAPSHDHGKITLVHAERLICNFIGACARATPKGSSKD